MGGDGQGRYNSESQDAQDDDSRHNGRLVLAEADPGILEVANRLVLKLLVRNPFPVVDKRKHVLGDVSKFSRILHFFFPILIRGSINP